MAEFYRHLPYRKFLNAWGMMLQFLIVIAGYLLLESFYGKTNIR